MFPFDWLVLTKKMGFWLSSLAGKGNLIVGWWIRGSKQFALTKAVFIWKDVELKILGNIGNKSRDLEAIYKKASRCVNAWKLSNGAIFENNYSHDRGSAWLRLRLRLILLATAAVANNVEEMMNSPDTKPSKPVTNTIPITTSL